MTTYTVTTSNWNSSAFWSGINEGLSGHTLDFTSLGLGYSVAIDKDLGTITIDDGTTSYVVGEAGFGGAADTYMGGASLLDYFTTLSLADGHHRITGDAAAEVITTGAGNDTIDAGGGNDTITAGDGDNRISGGTGDDDIVTGAGADYIQAGEGADSVLAGAGQDTIYGGWGGFSSDTLHGGAGNDLMFLGDGDDFGYGEADPDWIDGGAGNDFIDGGTESDRLLGDSGADTILGGANDDTLTGGAGSDNLSGGDGQDVIYGAAGDIVDGGEGGVDNDILNVSGVSSITYATAESGTVFFTAGGSLTFSNIETVVTMANDGIFSGTAGDDVISQFYVDADGDWIDNDDATGFAGTTGNDDYILAGAGNDTIWSSNGNDIVYGEDGADQIDSSSGADSVYGGAGNDTIDTGWGADYVEGGADDDWIQTFQDDDTVLGGAGNDTIDDESGSGNGSGNDSFDGGSGNDLLYGGDGNDTLLGGTGDDSLSGEDGDDSLLGGDDSDLFQFWWGMGNDTVAGGEGGLDSDTIDFSFMGDGVTVTFSGAEAGSFTHAGATGTGIFSEIEAVTLSAFGDTLDGSAATASIIAYGVGGNDSLTGGSASDTLGSGDGQDTLDGGAGADLLVGDATQFGDYTMLVGGAGADTLDGTAGGWDIAQYQASATGVFVNLLDGSPESGGDAAGDVLLGIEQIDGSDAGNDTIYGDAGVFEIKGWGGNDSIIGHDGGVVILGGDGNDTLASGSGDDSLVGGAGFNYFDGGLGNDTIDDTAGGWGILSYFGSTAGIDIDLTDALAEAGGFAQGDVISGVTQIDGSNLFDDVILSDGSATLLKGWGGNDTITAGAANSRIEGNDGADSLVGNTGDDSLTGGSGADTLFGADGADTLEGGAGADMITVGSGDSATGGDGDDVFVIGPDDLTGGALTVVGGETGETAGDRLDITGPATIQMTGAEAGTVTWLDGSVLTFSEIETVDYTPCFTAETRIKTIHGEVRADALRPGDLVLTRDSGYQPIRWHGARTLGAQALRATPRMRPIRIALGSLGPRTPERDLIVSPQHRVLLNGPRVELVTGEDEVLVAAKHLVGRPGIAISDARDVTYIHFLFDRHELVLSDGAWTESFQPGETSLGALDAAQRDEILALFPELATHRAGVAFDSARSTLRRFEALACAGDPRASSN